jgi:hypothetical protein
MLAYRGEFFRQIVGEDCYDAKRQDIDDFDRWMNDFVQYIFEEMPPTDDMCWEELRSGGLFTQANLGKIHKERYPSLEEAIMTQRFVFFLERQGFDGIKYENNTEDLGSYS